MQGLEAPLRAGVQQGRFARWFAVAPADPRVQAAGAERESAAAFSTPQPPGGNIAMRQRLDLFRLDLDVRYAGTRTLHFSTLKAQLAQLVASGQ